MSRDRNDQDWKVPWPKQPDWNGSDRKSCSALQLIWRRRTRAHTIAHVCYLQRKSVFVRPLPNADFLSSDWFM